MQLPANLGRVWLLAQPPLQAVAVQHPPVQLNRAAHTALCTRCSRETSRQNFFSFNSIMSSWRKKLAGSGKALTE